MRRASLISCATESVLTIVDVGANVDYYVPQMAYWSRPGGRVVTFEPNPEARVILKKHVRLNGFADDVKVVPAAAGTLAGCYVVHTC